MTSKIRGHATGWRSASVVVAAASVALLAAVPAAQAATASAPLTAKTALDVKSAVWPEEYAGDCQQDNGTIVIRSDGTGDWSATTLTYQTHSGDIWHSSFDFYTTAGFHLFSVGTFDSPRMDDGNPPPRYTWGAHFTFDPAEFAGVDISKTYQHWSC